MKILYVNESLKIELEPSKQAAIVNKHNEFVEIAFVKPIAHDEDIDGSYLKKGKWHQHNYPYTGSAKLPSAEICILANHCSPKPIFSNCWTSSFVCNKQGQIEEWYMVDQLGNINLENCGFIAKNVFASIIISTEEFIKINPKVNFDEYLFSNAN